MMVTEATFSHWHRKLLFLEVTLKNAENEAVKARLRKKIEMYRNKIQQYLKEKEAAR